MYAEFETALAAEIESDTAGFLTEEQWAEHVLYSIDRDLCVRMWREGIAITPETTLKEYQNDGR